MSRINRIYFYYRQLGLPETLKFVLSRFFTVHLNDYGKYLALFADKSGLEIGGPSDCFNSDNVLPIYSAIRNLDSVNFSANTIWEGSLSDGGTFKYERSTKVGCQYIRDAVDLSLIPSEKYDFIIACNSLEHIANPLKAIKEWLRVIKPNALFLLVLPNRIINFDHNRNVATLSHLINDYNCNTSEDDLSHLDEILKTHDLSLDPLAGTLENLKNRSMQNHANRALHQHVFDMELLQEIYNFFNIPVLLKHATVSDYFILGRKV
jgi:SAM-dependent methyltransferase